MANTTLSVANGHTDSLIEYVLDVKPYHTKLSSIVEEYLFEDKLNVRLVANMKSMTILGVDYLKAGNNPQRNVWDNKSPRPDSLLNADKTFIPGTRRSYGIPASVVNKLFSQSQKELYEVNSADQSDIPGLGMGVVSNVRYDGPGIPLVLRNTTALTEGVGYHISQGAFSFNTYGTYWRPFDLEKSNYPELEITDHFIDYKDQPGALTYRDVKKSYGQIKDITASVPEEWTLTWVESASHLTVVGSMSGLIGTASFDVPFVHAKLSFLFTAFSQVVPPQPPPISNGDKFVLTPTNKIVLNPGSPDQTWTIIKVNPIALAGEPVFSGPAGITPSLSVYTRSLAFTPATTFTIVFTAPGEYTILTNNELTGYPKTGNTTSSFKDEYVHFTIQANGRTLTVGDSFTFTTLAPSDQSHYLVYGSETGWTTPAKINQWYYNGHIGFKIPKLEYFACMAGNISDTTGLAFTAGREPHPCARPSKYEIVYRNIPNSVPYATVEHNINGFKSSLVSGVPWADEDCSFTINSIHGPTDRVTVFLAYRSPRVLPGGYDVFPYDTTPYDLEYVDSSISEYLMEEYFPFYHSYGSVIVPGVVNSDLITVDKVEREFVRLNLNNLDDSLANVDSQGWIPLVFFYDSVFPDRVTKITAKLASNTDFKVFEIRQPLNSGAVLEFNQPWFEQYVTGTEAMTIRFHQQSTWAQMIHVKMTDALVIDGQIGLDFDEASSPQSTQASMSEEVTFKLYIDGILSMFSFVFPISDKETAVKVDEEASTYKITFDDIVSFTSIRITPDVGNPFNVTLAPIADDAYSFMFTVPSGTGPFTVSLYQGGLGFDLGGPLGG